MKRHSIKPTYDHRETGDRFTVETRLNDRRVSVTPTRDPFVCRRVTIGWPDLLAGLLRRRLIVEVLVGGDREIVDDVMELDADCLTDNSTRRADFDRDLRRALYTVGDDE